MVKLTHTLITPKNLLTHLSVLISFDLNICRPFFPSSQSAFSRKTKENNIFWTILDMKSPPIDSSSRVYLCCESILKCNFVTQKKFFSTSIFLTRKKTKKFPWDLSSTFESGNAHLFLLLNCCSILDIFNFWSFIFYYVISVW